jgi:RNA polymerase sigma-70 factor (sigma-E family)
VTFDEFLDAELTGLRRYAGALTGDSQRAHDVLADALLKAHAGWRRIGAMDFPLAYVRRIVTSTFLSERRRWSVRMIRPTRTGDLPDVAVPDPASVVDDREHLRRLLAALPPRQRAAVALRYYLGLDTAEIAAELGITEGAVRTTISRALAALRIAIGDEPAGTDTDTTTTSIQASRVQSRSPGLERARTAASDQRTDAERS